MEFEILRLTNGLRVLHVEDKSIMTVHCGFIINAGSRDEATHENGLAHLIEHCLFKGTKRRRAFHILNRLDSVGGEINAYTTKEETCIYASSLKEHFQRAAELLVDITFSSRFPDKEIQKEKTVILDELNSYRDSPDEMLMDEFEERLFPNSSLGRSILGSEDQIKGFKRDDIIRFVERLYTTDQIVFVVVGNLSLRRLESFARKVLEPIPLHRSNGSERLLPPSEQFDLAKNEQVHQVHSLIGCKTIGYDSDKRRAMVLMNNVLGGPALNSRLNLNIRERYGYCYYIESNYTPYADCGIFQVYYGTDKRFHKRVQKMVMKELMLMAETPLTSRMLDAAKKQMIGQIALGQENRVSLMLAMGKSLLQFDRIDSFEEIKEDVFSIKADELSSLAQETFVDAELSFLSYIPT
ncbi:MAG: pitrilysin family protein [Salibacteraceae bacterium]